MPESTAERATVDALLAGVPEGVFVMDGRRRFVLFNDACERMTGYAAADVLGSSCECSEAAPCEAQYGRSLAGTLCPGRAIFADQNRTRRQRLQLRRKDGRTVWADAAYTSIRDDAGDIECVVGVMRSVPEDQAHDEALREATADLAAQLHSVHEHAPCHNDIEGLVSVSPAMTPVFEKVRAAAANRSPVLIVGETGTGKETVARAIHAAGREQAEPFVVVHCAALPSQRVDRELFGQTGDDGDDFPGLFRAAGGGTVFLDDLAALPAETQAELVRAVDDGRVRPLGGTNEVAFAARVIAAISQPVPEAVADGALRQDLAYQVGIVTIALPPLRRRRHDIPLFVSQIIDRAVRQGARAVTRVAPRAWEILTSHDWPGNLRELQNAVASAVAIGRGDTLRAEDLPPALAGGVVTLLGRIPDDDLNLDTMLRRLERSLIAAALRRAGGQRSRAAQLMGISRSRLYRRMDALGVDPNAPS